MSAERTRAGSSRRASRRARCELVARLRERRVTSAERATVALGACERHAGCYGRAVSHAPHRSHVLTARLVALATALSPVACSTTVYPEPPTGAGSDSGAGAGAGKTDVEKPGESDGATGEKRVFITSVAYKGNLAVVGRGETGVEGADALCQLAADAAELGGTFKAFLGDSSRWAGDDLADVGPWFTVPDGAGFAEKVFNNKANLATSPLVAVVNDERGVPTNEAFWVGDGTEHCDDWHTSVGTYVGSAAYVGGGTSWRSGDYDATCDVTLRLLCFQQ